LSVLEAAAVQLFCRSADLGAEQAALVKELDIGDIVGTEGRLFFTRTGELTLRAAQLRLLVKSLRPLPEKWHGLTDVEQRFRRRYVDLIVNARVACDPEWLEELVRDEVIGAVEARGASVEFRQTQSFRPGRPVPTHRFGEAD